MFVSEGGWSSQQVGTYTENTQKQADYITKQLQLLDNANAIALFQLTFCDIDPNGIGTVPATLNQFIYIGLVDTSLNAKPALALWDAGFKRVRQ